DTEAEEQAAQVIDEPSRRGGVIDAAAPAVLVDRHGPVRGPDVLDEEGDLLLGEAEDLLRHELLVRSQAEELQAIEPLCARVQLASGKRKGCPESQRADAGSRVVVPDGRDTEG